MYCEDGAILPIRATSGSSGYDLYWYSRDKERVFLHVLPGCTRTIPTGVYIQLPPGKEAQIRSKSGLASKHGIHVLNSPGTIDSDYRGEILVILHNSSAEPYQINKSKAIAQMVIQSVDIESEFKLVNNREELDPTIRGTGGLGSTEIN